MKSATVPDPVHAETGIGYSVLAQDVLHLPGVQDFQAPSLHVFRRRLVQPLLRPHRKPAKTLLEESAKYLHRTLRAPIRDSTFIAVAVDPVFHQIDDE
jgi:hypothetical protein